MGAIQVIEKSRKEFKCGRCHKVIPTGSKYYRAELNFSKPVVRCAKCGLAHWEVTTSEYQLSVGEIIYHWEDNFGLTDDTAEEISSNLQDIRDDVQERLDNMPEGVQDGDVGQLLQSRINELESAIDELDSIDIDSIKEAAIEEIVDYDMMEDLGLDIDDTPIWENLSDKFNNSIVHEITEWFESEYRDQIEVALNNIEI